MAYQFIRSKANPPHREDGVLHDDQDHRLLVVDKSQRAVLQFAGKDA